MKKWLRAAIVASFVAPLFAGLAPHASADPPIRIGPVTIKENPTRVEVFEPGIIYACIRVAHSCDGPGD